MGFSLSYTFLPTCSLFFSLFIFFFLAFVHCNAGVQVQIHRNRAVLPRIHFSPSNAFKLNISFLLHPSPHKHIPHFPSCTLLLLLHSSIADWATGRSLSQRGHRLDCIRVYYLISPTIQLLSQLPPSSWIFSTQNLIICALWALNSMDPLILLQGETQAMLVVYKCMELLLKPAIKS